MVLLKKFTNRQVVAYALAGRVDIDFDAEPLGMEPHV